MAFLEVENLSKNFGGLNAIIDLSFSVDKGQIIAIIGPNGAGKTTLFNLLTGFSKPNAGQIFFQGENISGLKPSTIAKKGMVRTFQEGDLFQEKTVLENLYLAHHLKAKASFWSMVFGLSSYKSQENRIYENIIKILQHVGLQSLKNELAKNLPHGFRKMLAICLALAAHPKMLLLDEPVAGMRPDETDQLMNWIKKLTTTGISVIIVEHNIKVVMEFCEKIIVLDFGKKIAEGRPEIIKENKSVIQAYLGSDDEYC